MRPILIIVTLGLLLNLPLDAPAHAASPSPVAKDARLGGDIKRTRFVADLSHIVDFRAFTLQDPYRVVIDLPEVNFQMPPRLGTKGFGLVSAFRYGLIAPGKSRIVIDVVAPIRIDKAFVRPPDNGLPARLVVDLVRVSRDEFLRHMGKSVGTSKEAQAESEGDNDGLAVKSIPKADKIRPVVVIDPGHGGIDPGASSPTGTQEKDIVFKFAQELKSQIDALGRYDVHLTRDIDMFIPLGERVDIGRHYRADLFISIHADTLNLKRKWPKTVEARAVRGATIYTLSEDASDEEAKALAAKENRSDIIAGVDLTDKSDDVSLILIDLMRRETKNFSLAFAQMALDKIRGTTALNRKPIRHAAFRVLRAPDVPSVLIELGYLSNPDDEKNLISQDWRKAVCDQLAGAVDAFFSKREVRLPY